jgi:hypothetical protein
VHISEVHRQGRVFLSEQAISERFAKVLQDALDRPIAFHRIFVKLTGSVTAALLLSQAMYWSRRANLNDKGWFYKTRDQWEEETGLSRYEQESARKALRRLSFWKEDLRGVPAQMHYRIDIAAMSTELLLLAGSSDTKGKINGNVKLLESSQLDGGKPASKKADNQPACLPETSQPYKGLSETTTEITTTPLTPLEPTPDQPGGGRDFVEKLLAGTMLHEADPGRISKAAKKYRRTQDETALAIDILDQQYRQSIRKIDDPTALVVSALKDGIDPPEGYVPKAEREAEAGRKREAARKLQDEERRAREAEDTAYREAEAKLSALPEEQLDELFAQVKTMLPAILRDSRLAVRTEAIRMLIAEARAPD